MRVFMGEKSANEWVRIFFCYLRYCKIIFRLFYWYNIFIFLNLSFNRLFVFSFIFFLFLSWIIVQVWLLFQFSTNTMRKFRSLQYQICNHKQSRANIYRKKICFCKTWYHAFEGNVDRNCYVDLEDEKISNKVLE